MTSDLFEQLPDGADLTYINLRAASTDNARLCRDFCQRLWARFERYADDGFVQDFPVHVHQRFWEMYLTVAMLDAGYAVTAAKPGPDICVRHRGQRVWIEAVAATAGDPSHPDSVPAYEPPREGEIISGFVPQDQIVLRCTAAIAQKYPLQFRKHVEAGIIGPEDRYVVAVNLAQAYYWMDHGTPPYILRAVLGLGHHFATIDRNTGKVARTGITYRAEIPKTRGRPVDANLFLSDESSRLSAVICSFANVALPVNMPDGRFGQDFLLVDNPKSAVPLRGGLLDRGFSFRATISDDSFQVTGRRIRFGWLRRLFRLLRLL